MQSKKCNEQKKTHNAKKILESTDSTKYKIDEYTKIRKGKLAFCIPLTHIFGFVECYNKMIYGRKHALSLYRTSNSKNAIFSTDPSTFEAKLTITRLQWLISKIIPSLEMQNKLMNMFESRKLFNLPFISRQLEGYSVPVSSRDFTWKLGIKYDKIKYFIIGFQRDCESNYLNASRFDSCDLPFFYSSIGIPLRYMDEVFGEVLLELFPQLLGVGWLSIH